MSTSLGRVRYGTPNAPLFIRSVRYAGEERTLRLILIKPKSIEVLGLRRREEIDAAIAGVKQGKLTPAELDYLNLYGDLYRNKLKIQETSPERLLYRD